jgi:hypothetical protein
VTPSTSRHKTCAWILSQEDISWANQSVVLVIQMIRNSITQGPIRASMVELKYVRELLPSCPCFNNLMSIISIQQAASAPAGNGMVEQMCCNYTLLSGLKRELDG